MTREDVAVLSSMAIVPAVLGLLFVLAMLAVSRTASATRQLSYAIAAGIFGVLMVLGLASVFWFWGVGFEYADTYRTPPAYVDRVQVTSFWVAAAAYAGVLVTGLLAHRARRRQTAES